MDLPSLYPLHTQRYPKPQALNPKLYLYTYSYMYILCRGPRIALQNAKGAIDGNDDKKNCNYEYHRWDD